MHLLLNALTWMALLKITAPEINSRKAHTKPSSYFRVGGGMKVSTRKLSFLELNLSVPMYSWGQCSKQPWPQLSPGGHPRAPGAGQIPSVGAAPAGAATGTQDTEMPPIRSILVPGSHHCWSFEGLQQWKHTLRTKPARSCSPSWLQQLWWSHPVIWQMQSKPFTRIPPGKGGRAALIQAFRWRRFKTTYLGATGNSL